MDELWTSAKTHRHKGNWEVAVLDYTRAIEAGQVLVEAAAEAAASGDAAAEAVLLGTVRHVRIEIAHPLCGSAVFRR